MPRFAPGSVFRLSLSVLLGVTAYEVAQSPVQAEIRAGKGKGFGTKVNGKKSGRCNGGICLITGGKSSGRNKFLKFKDFDTRGSIKRVEFDTSGKRNLIVGVTSRLGSYIDKTLKMSSKSNVIWMSPGGIHLGTGARFVNVPKLSLTTSSNLKFARGTFDLFKTQASALQALNDDPLPGSLGFGEVGDLDDWLNASTGADGRVPGIQLEGIDIRIDRELFADALDGSVEVRNSTIAVGGPEEPDARLTLTGNAVTIGAGSSLQAQHRDGGGLIEVGGSWQNSDPAVRQAKRSIVETGALLNVSAGEFGDGGEIVVWSNINNPESQTIVSGELRARGGFDHGNGGRIETSGYMLDVYGIQIDATAEKGINGLWLLDPRDIIIDIFEFSSGLSGTNTMDILLTIYHFLIRLL